LFLGKAINGQFHQKPGSARPVDWVNVGGIVEAPAADEPLHVLSDREVAASHQLSN
jgi:hypothetical protein